MRTYSFFAFSAIALATACADGTPSAPSTEQNGTTPVENAAAIAAEYIVVLRDDERDVAGTASRLAAFAGGRVKHTLSEGLNVFLLETSSASSIEGLRSRSEVRLVERNTPTYAARSIGPTLFAASWGIDRIDQIAPPLDHFYTAHRTATNVHAYVVDTGIYPDHWQFRPANNGISRVSGGVSYIVDAWGTNDCDGHGTAVAAILGGDSFGVARDVRLHPVRVLDCWGDGTSYQLVQGLTWILNNHIKPAVVNISMSGPANSSVNLAVNLLVLKGVTVVAAAGNENANACYSSPSGAQGSLTIGATTKADAFWSVNSVKGSNYGPCIDLFAPGVGIETAWIGRPDTTASVTGTSAAAPHVAGTVALLLDKYPNAIPGEIHQAIIASATKGIITNAGTTSPNRMLYMGFVQ